MSAKSDKTPLGDKLKKFANDAEMAKNIAVRHSLTPSKTEESLADLVKQGNLLLAQEAKAKTVPQTKSTTAEPSNKKTPILNPNNPYVAARIKVLATYKPWRVKEIEEMEKEGNTNNRFYMDFVSEVMTLGDKLSSK